MRYTQIIFCLLYTLCSLGCEEQKDSYVTTKRRFLNEEHKAKILKSIKSLLVEKKDVWDNKPIKDDLFLRTEKDLFSEEEEKINPWDFFSSKENGDELWLYSTPKEYWQSLTGESGFALVRNGEVVDYIAIIVN